MTRSLRAVAVLWAVAPAALAQYQGIGGPVSITHGQLGERACVIPDCTGDGYPEFALGASSRPHGPAIPEHGKARVFIYSGATGAYVTHFFPPVFAGPYALAGIDDASGDGRGDLAVGVPQFHPPGGRVHLYSPAESVWLRALTPPSGAAGLHFGVSVAAMPDADGDGLGDVLVGAPLPVETFIAGATGRAFLMSGATGLALRILTPPAVMQDPGFGSLVLSIPDLTADGRADVLVGGSGSVHVYSGTTGARVYTIIGPRTPPSLVAGAPVFGHAAASVPDVDNDGVDDLVISNPSVPVGVGPMSPAFAPDAGAIYIYSGRTGVLRRTVLGPPIGMNHFGWSVAGVPDQNGDGRGDIAVTAPLNPDVFHGGYGPGVVFVLSGFSGNRLRNLPSPHPENGGRLGSAVLALPDLTGDGRAELVITAPYEDPSGDPFKDIGRAYIVRQ
ncbi:MAG: VCBS repeat-containing protein [Phycisphaerales bacterium]|nr:VCBS repeat-containing protein [Phycisphaerales bacterium]